MSKPTGSKSASGRKSGSPLLTGILVGMMVGVALAAGLAWFIMRSPSPFVNKEAATKSPAESSVVEKPAVEIVKPAVPHPRIETASGVEEAKPRFEFYKVLTDKQELNSADSAPKTSEKPPKAEKPAVTEKAPETKSPAQAKANYLQAGAFASSSDAENLKANLAMKGIEAHVQTVTIPGKGVWHRVRVGPFSSEQEMNNVRGTLKLNGMEATPTH
jgi:cell division protein FtsN